MQYGMYYRISFIMYIKYSVSEMLIFRKTPDKNEANSKVKNGFILNLYEK